MAIEISYQMVLYIYQSLFVIAVLYAFRETIQDRLYGGVRFLRWVEIDTGRIGYATLNKSLNKAKILGNERTINRDNVKKGIAYFVSGNVENLALEDAASRWEYYCNTDEFNSVYKNKLLLQLLYVLQANIIKLVFLGVLITAALAGYDLYLIRGIASNQQIISSQLDLLNQTAAGLIHIAGQQGVIPGVVSLPEH